MSVSVKVIKSAFLLLGLQIIQRGLGIVSTLLLARLLTPEHFGIVAIVTIALQFFELLVETGNQQYIVQKKNLSDDDLNTAWSMNILAKSVIAFLIIIVSPWIAGFYDAPALSLALAISALSLPIRALQTPGMMLLVRQLRYRPMFRLTLWQKGISFLTTIIIAFIYPSHWAIITGNLVSAIILAAGSYYVDAYRPSWTLKFLKKQWQFSQWLLLRGIVGFTRSQIDNLFVSKIFGTEKLGGYNLVREISLLPALSVIMPMSEPLTAAIAQSKTEPENLRYRIQYSLWIMIGLLTPITLFIMFYPTLIVGVLLGETWNEYSHLLQPFGLLFFSYCLFGLICDAMIAQGKVKRLFQLDVLSTGIIIVILFQFGTDNLSTMAWARGWLGIATTFGYLLVLKYQVGISLMRLCYLSSPVIIGCLIGLEIAGFPDMSGMNMILELLLRGLLYSSSCLLTVVVLAYLLLHKQKEWGQTQSLVKNFLVRS